MLFKINHRSKWIGFIKLNTKSDNVIVFVCKQVFFVHDDLRIFLKQNMLMQDRKKKQ